jgi:serine/threonine protein kinase
MADPSYKKIDTYYYDPTKPIGKGAYAAVFKAFDERTDDPVAVKVIPSSKFLESDNQFNLIMSEVNILRSLQGEHIVRLIDVKRTSGSLYIFIDFCDGGDLEKKLRSKYPFTEEEALTIIKQIAHAFVTLENSDILTSSGRKAVIMHRDIKPANILFHQGKAKVADFGFSKIIDEMDMNTKSAHTLLGTPLYMAPQILNDERYTVKCDVWSTGLVLYEIIFGRLPWTGHSIPNLYMNIKSKPLTFPKTVSDDTKDLITKMLSQKEETRLSWRSL